MTEPHLNPPADAVVLLVEDDALVRMVAVEVLSGFDVLTAADAAEALLILRSGCIPDVLVTDVRMPGEIDGLGLAAIVAESWPQVGILVISAHACPTARDLPAGAAFLPKPHTPAALVREVTALVRSPTLTVALDDA
jgi:CheY-like chemotaxis protein